MPADSDSPRLAAEPGISVSRRAGISARCLNPGADTEPAGRSAEETWPDIPVRFARPQDREAVLRPHDRDVSWSPAGERGSSEADLSRAQTSLHARLSANRVACRARERWEKAAERAEDLEEARQAPSRSTMRASTRGTASNASKRVASRRRRSGRHRRRSAKWLVSCSTSELRGLKLSNKKQDHVNNGEET